MAGRGLPLQWTQRPKGATLKILLFYGTETERQAMQRLNPHLVVLDPSQLEPLYLELGRLLVAIAPQSANDAP